MSKLNQLILSGVLTVVIMIWLNVSVANMNANTPSTWTTTATTETPTPATNTEETPQPVDAFWAGALNIQQLTGKRCTVDVCEYLKISTTKTCSRITLFGVTTKDSGKVIDYFEQDLKRLSKGSSRVVEFGTDPANSYETFVELQDATCWK